MDETEGQACDRSRSCHGRECGDDGCGGRCGECALPETCDEKSGVCVCAPACEGKPCGAEDGCGGKCEGFCPDGETCRNFRCVASQCEANCGDRVCGNAGFEVCPSDYCGVCPGGKICLPEGRCVSCSPDCEGKECGPDGCGGSCGDCTSLNSCTPEGACRCTPDCDGKECGDDGCGGNCGDCPQWQRCTEEGACEACTPNCEDIECGPEPNGCGRCGDCSEGRICVVENWCCLPNCSGRTCGNDGCGGSCGECGVSETCVEMEGVCVPSDCGPFTHFGCCHGQTVKWCVEGELRIEHCEETGLLAGTCGWKNADWGYWCGYEGEDPTGQNPIDCPLCTPDCEGKVCGGDRCGGLCGECSEPEVCHNGACVMPPSCEDDYNCPGSDICNEQGVCRVPKEGERCFTDCEWPASCFNSVCFVCTPNCGGKECGNDGCLGGCGICGDEKFCGEDFTCVPCTCEGKECGDDGCFNSLNPCGECPGDEFCDESGICIPCSCEGKECGFNECQNWCGECLGDEFCGESGTCIPCTPCEGKECGFDECDYYCGECPEDKVCEEGTCRSRPLSCSSDFECGVGRICDWFNTGKCRLPREGEPCSLYCEPPAICDRYEGMCILTCTPDCEGKECGDDGCGGSCGDCAPLMTCGGGGMPFVCGQR